MPAKKKATKSVVKTTVTALDDPIVICLIESDEEIWIMLTEDHGNYVLRGFESVQKGLDFFEKGYNLAHARSAEFITGATLNWMFFQPSIIKTSLREVQDKIAAKSRKCVSKRSVAGGMDLLATEPIAKELYKKGKKPHSISYDDRGFMKHIPAEVCEADKKKREVEEKWRRGELA